MNLKNLFLAGITVIAAQLAEAAPFYPNFHNVKAETLFSNFAEYPMKGMGMQTLSLYRSGNNVLAAGSFSTHVKGPWYARGNMTTQEFSQWFNHYGSLGFRPREVSVMMWNNQPRFSAVWKKTQGEAYATWINMSDAEFTARWNDLVKNKGYRIEDYAAYMVNGQKRHAAVYVKDGKGFYLYMGMSQAQFSQRFQALAQQGFYPSSINVAQTPAGETFSAVWSKPTGGTYTYVNMSATGYQQRFDQMSAQGFRLHKIQGYAGGTKFAAIWVK